jgi:hypothetical protein
MPGSPPISTTEPSTSPPPSTLSNSSMPVGIRSSSSAATLPSSWTSCVGASAAKRFLAGGRSASTVSTSVFQAWQCGHCPSHFGFAPPHSLQT